MSVAANDGRDWARGNEKGETAWELERTLYRGFILPVLSRRSPKVTEPRSRGLDL